MKVAIIGGGIAGLGLALGLHARGIACDVYESVPEVKEMGVGITLLPHATKELAALGVLPQLEAVAIENLDLYEDLDLINHVQANEANFKQTLDKLNDLDIVGDVRGTGFFYAIELVKDKATKTRFDLEEIEKLLRGFITKDLYSKGLYCRADDRGDPVVQLAPPLTSDQADFDMMEANVRETLTKAWDLVK